MSGVLNIGYLILYVKILVFAVFVFFGSCLILFGFACFLKGERCCLIQKKQQLLITLVIIHKSVLIRSL